MTTFVCGWKSEADHTLWVEVNKKKGDLVASLWDTTTNQLVGTKVSRPLLEVVFDRCVWKSNLFPADNPFESRLFYAPKTKKATWIGIEFKDDTRQLHIRSIPNFENGKLNTHAPFLNRGTNGMEYEELAEKPEEDYDSQAEMGMIRPTKSGSRQEIVHVWGHVGPKGLCDVRLIRKDKSNQKGIAQEELILELFYRFTGLIKPIKLTNTSDDLVGNTVLIQDRIDNFTNYRIAILSRSKGSSSYGSVTLPVEDEIPTAYQGFFEGQNLQAVSDKKVAEYVRDELLVIRGPKGEIIKEVKHRARIAVSRTKEYDFGAEHGKYDAVHIHMSAGIKQQWLYLPGKMVVAFFSGMVNRDAPKIHQLKDLDEKGMGDLIGNNQGAALDDTRKMAIFQEFDGAIRAGKNIDYYIAENRQTAELIVAGVAFRIRSGATSIGRFVSGRGWIWDNPSQPQAPIVKEQSASKASGLLFPCHKKNSSKGLSRARTVISPSKSQKPDSEPQLENTDSELELETTDSEAESQLTDSEA